MDGLACHCGDEIEVFVHGEDRESGSLGDRGDQKVRN